MALLTISTPDNIPYCVNGTLTPIAKNYVAQLFSAGAALDVNAVALDLNVTVVELSAFLHYGYNESTLAEFAAAAAAEEAAVWE